MPYIIRDKNVCDKLTDEYWYAARDKFVVGFVLDIHNATFFNTADSAREFYRDYHEYFEKYGMSSPFMNYKSFLAQKPELCEIKVMSVEVLKCHT